MNIYRLIERDHRETARLLSRIGRPLPQSDFDAAGRQYLLDHLISIMSRHEAAEEIALWPAVRQRLPDGPEVAANAIRAEQVIRGSLDLLGRVHSEPEFLAESRRLERLVDEHHTSEEQSVFPALRRRSTFVWASLAGTSFRLARRLGPTRPHPGGPSRPLGWVTRGAISSSLDHLRDFPHRSRRPVDVEDSHHIGAVGVLTEYHDRLTGLLDQLRQGRGADRGVVHETVRVVSVHESIERQHLFPVVRQRFTDGDRRHEHLLEQHGRVARAAGNLDRYRFDGPPRLAMIDDLSAGIGSLIEYEKSAILPELAARMTQEELVELGQLLRTASETAPTRPHSHLGGSGAGARLSGLVLAPLDKTRDKLAQRRST